MVEQVLLLLKSFNLSFFFNKIAKVAQFTLSVMLFIHVCAHNILEPLYVVTELQKETKTILL